jgi:hypothetical protein
MSSSTAVSSSLEALIGHLERLHERTRLVARLLVLGRRTRVGDDAGAGLKRGEGAAHRDRPDGDTEVEIARAVEIPDRAAVESTPRGLERAHDLHGADLRRAGKRPGGKGRRQCVEPIATWRQLAFDARHHVHDVRVALDFHVLTDTHTADRRDAPDVVPAEIDEHHVLGPFLLVGLELGRERRVFFG